MNLEERNEYLEKINLNQEKSLKSLYKELDAWERQVNYLQARVNKYDKFLDMVCEKCEGSLLWYQYRWVVQTISKFQSEMRDD